MDEHVTSRAIGEGIDHVSIGDVGKLVVLLGWMYSWRVSPVLYL
jgi:hypothetical protein